MWNEWELDDDGMKLCEATLDTHNQKRPLLVTQCARAVPRRLYTMVIISIVREYHGATRQDIVFRRIEHSLFLAQFTPFRAVA